MTTKLKILEGGVTGYNPEYVKELEQALEKIREEVGTSTLAWKIANDILLEESSPKRASWYG